MNMQVAMNIMAEAIAVAVELVMRGGMKRMQSEPSTMAAIISGSQPLRGLAWSRRHIAIETVIAVKETMNICECSRCPMRRFIDGIRYAQRVVTRAMDARGTINSRICCQPYGEIVAISRLARSHIPGEVMINAVPEIYTVRSIHHDGLRVLRWSMA